MKNKKVLLVIPFVFLSLILGIYTGWLRMGWTFPVTNSMAFHGLLMVGSFLGTLIILERVVVLKKKWLYVFPVLNGLSLPAFLSQMDRVAVIFLLTGTIGLLYIFGIIYHRFRERYILIMMAGGVLLLIGHFIVFFGGQYASAVPFWIGFLLLTIVGERLDLGKFLPKRRLKKPLLYLALIFFTAGLFTGFHSTGHLLSGTGILIMALWLMYYDIVRKSMKSHGLTKYVGIALFTGYLWLLVTAVLMLWSPETEFAYDALLHSFFLGFTFLMIFAHAPIIFPGVAGLSFRPFHWSLYVWVVLLNISLFARIGADHMSSFAFRQLTGMANGLTILGFFLNLIILVRGQLLKNISYTVEQRRPSKLYMRLAMIFFIVTGILGLLIRWQFFHPIPRFNYTNWLHAHSHVAFLGWVFMGLLAMVFRMYEREKLFPGVEFRHLAWWIVATNAGMLIFFPLQGYGPVSIFFSAMHMILGIYSFNLLRPVLNEYRSFGSDLIQWGFIFMIFSGAGPLVLGPVVALGLKSSPWYTGAIYFYLHFQYNGFFTLTILGLILRYLERKGSLVYPVKAGIMLFTVVIAVLLTFPLSLLAGNPPVWVYVTGGTGALLQAGCILYMLFLILNRYQIFKSRTGLYTNILLVASITFLLIKVCLQALSALPVVSGWVFSGRQIIIAYLHLVLLGFVSMFIIGWWRKLSGGGDNHRYGMGVVSYFLGFAGMEIILLLLGLEAFHETEYPFEQLILFSASILAGVIIMFSEIIRPRHKSRGSEFRVKKDAPLVKSVS